MFRRTILLAALLLASLAAPASAQTFRMEYEAVAYGILPFGRASIDATVESGRYQASAFLRTTGLAALVARARAQATSRGRYGADVGMAPARYDLDHEHMGHRNSWVDWSGKTVALDSTPIFRDRGDPPANEAQKRAGRDPLSSLLTMGAHVARTQRCDGVFRVFDGLYVYDISLRQIGEGRFERADIDWPVVRCGLLQRRVAGYGSPGDLAKTMQAELWFAIRPDAPFAIPVRVSQRLPLGVATVRLARFSED
jgi:hypothetical protein